MSDATVPTVLATARLRLRPFRADDLALLHTLYGDARVMAIRKIGPQDRDGSARQLAGIVAAWRMHGYGLWAVFDRSDGAFLGECGLRHRAEDDAVELAYGLVPDAWGRGLATEAAAAVLAFAFARLSVPRVVAVARADNAASHNVMRKLGMRLVARRPRPEDGGVVEYAVEADAWRRHSR